MSEIFRLKDIVIEYCSNGNFKYCVKNGLLFKCSGGFKDYKKQQYISTKYKSLNYVNLTCSQELKNLAYRMNIPVLHSRKIKKLKKKKVLKNEV
jgi:hypothetical protein